MCMPLDVIGHTLCKVVTLRRLYSVEDDILLIFLSLSLQSKCQSFYGNSWCNYYNYPQ